MTMPSVSISLAFGINWITLACTTSLKQNTGRDIHYERQTISEKSTARAPAEPFGVLALALFLIATGTSRQAIFFIALVWIVVVVCYLTVSFFIQKRHCETLLVMAEQLGEKYLMPEVMSMPERADEQVFYQILKMAEKSMLEKIGRNPERTARIQGIYRAMDAMRSKLRLPP